MYTTEETYVKSLQLCTMLYLEPITQWITASSAARLQGVVVMKMIQFYKNILQLHTLFLINLRNRFKSWSEHQKIGDLTITITPCLRMYKLYGEDYENMLKLLDNFKRSSSTYRSIIKEGDNHPLNKLALESMLILPIQRIPRYVLLIQELTKRTENDHPDFVPLTKSLTALKKTSEDLNTAILQGEKRLKCIEISKLIKWEDLVVPHRYYINELTLEVNNGKKQEQQRLIIFNDLLLFLSDTPEPVKLDTISIDSHLVLKDESETSLILQSNSSGILKSKTTTTLTFPSEDKKTEFFSMLSKEMKIQEQANQSRNRKM
uniref:DH domain-containing protein n=1 Tax=Arcella intermedia TaxID=1963864 RepID=A0A6B2L8K3_9EUKA